MRKIVFDTPEAKDRVSSSRLCLGISRFSVQHRTEKIRLLNYCALWRSKLKISILRGPITLKLIVVGIGNDPVKRYVPRVWNNFLYFLAGKCDTNQFWSTPVLSVL